MLAEVATTLAHVLTRGGNRVGAVVFDHGVERGASRRRRAATRCCGSPTRSSTGASARGRRASEAASATEPRPPAEPRADSGPERHVTDLGAMLHRSAADDPRGGRSSSSSPTSSRGPGGRRRWRGSPGGTRWSPSRSATRARTSCPTSARSTSRTPRRASRSSSTPATPGSARGSGRGRRRRGRPTSRRGRARPASTCTGPDRRGPRPLAAAHLRAAAAEAAMSLERMALGAAGPARRPAARRRLPAAAAAAGATAEPTWRGRASSSPARADRWRHVAPVLLVAALAVMLLALSRPVAAVAEPRREGTVILAFDVSTSMAAKDMQPIAARRGQGRGRGVRREAAGDGEDRRRRLRRERHRRPAADDRQDRVLAAVNRLTPQGDTSLGGGILTSLSAIAGKPIISPATPRQGTAARRRSATTAARRSSCSPTARTPAAPTPRPGRPGVGGRRADLHDRARHAGGDGDRGRRLQHRDAPRRGRPAADRGDAGRDLSTRPTPPRWRRSTTRSS